MRDTILCIGEALIDFIPNEFDKPLKKVNSFKPMVGGAPANVSAAIAKLGGKAKLLTKVGDDAFGNKIIDELRESGVDTSLIMIDENYDTSLAFVSLTDEGNRDFMFYRRTAADLNLKVDELPRDIMDDVSIFHFGSVDLINSSTKEVHNHLIKLAKLNDVLISFDPNVRLMLWNDSTLYQDTIQEYLQYADIVKISDDELEFITGKNDLEDGLEYLFSLGIKQVLYTMGKNGARVYFEDLTYIEARRHNVDVVDTTGAGDAFMGTYLFFLNSMKNEGMDDKVIAYLALLLANKCAAKSCAKYGAIASYLSAEEIEI